MRSPIAHGWAGGPPTLLNPPTQWVPHPCASRMGGMPTPPKGHSTPQLPELRSSNRAHRTQTLPVLRSRPPRHLQLLPPASLPRQRPRPHRLPLHPRTTITVTGLRQHSRRKPQPSGDSSRTPSPGTRQTWNSSRHSPAGETAPRSSSPKPPRPPPCRQVSAIEI